MEPGDLIGRFVNDIRNVLTPAPQERLVPRDTTSQTPLNIDRPSNHQEIYLPVEMPRVQPREGVTPIDNTIFRDRFSGRVTPGQYDDFLANQNAFRKMMQEWAERDDPLDRMGILDRYADNYGFQNNIIYEDLLNNIIGYDWAERFNPDAEITRGRSGRDEWINWVEENLNAATDIYGKRLYRNT